MPMRVVRKQLRRVSSQLYKKLYSLNHRDNGSMQDTLRDERSGRTGSKGIVHYILDGEKLIGWSLLYDDAYGKNKSDLYCHFYIRKSERRKGYGSQLFYANIKYTRRLGKTFRTTPDKNNRKFFKKVKGRAAIG
ncbi:hypothetical protein LCGC14_2131330 [marine sediment metagenome]|uniref:N-acetyltransferase domain-containing protein n=1 Tax=marine sediment metagenome TaxID=412755 RepID=A0A0F9GXF6_9ZZZZ